MAVFAIDPALAFELERGRRPAAGSGALRDGLPCKARIARGDARHQRVAHLLRHMAAEIGLDPARMHRIGVDAHDGIALLDPDREQHVGGLGLAIAAPRIIGAVLVIGVFEVDRAHVVPPARQIDDALARALLDQGQEFGGEGKVAQMIGAELALEPVGGVLEGRGHHPGVVDEQIDLGKPLARARGCGADGLERGEVDRDGIELGVRH